MGEVIYKGFNLSAMVKSIFPNCSVSLHLHDFMRCPLLHIYVMPGVYSTIMIKLGHSYLMHNVAAPIYRTTNATPFLVNIFIAPPDDWTEDGYNEFNEYPEDFDPTKDFDGLPFASPHRTGHNPVGNINWFTKPQDDNDEDDDGRDWNDIWQDLTGND